jgi:hypothetical protein
MRFTCLITAVLATVTVSAAQADVMSGKQIRDAVIGKRIYLAVPMGGEFPLYYRPDGIVDGTGEALGLGRFMRPTDQGRWWVTGNSLCQQWKTWYDGKSTCFTLQQVDDDKLRWKRDDGYTGTARIAD